MPTAVTIYRANFLPSADLGNTTAEKQFINGRAVSPARLDCRLPSNGGMANKPFGIHIAGRVSTTTNRTFTVNLYFGRDTTITNNTLMLTSSANTVNNVSTSWDMWARCFWSRDGKSITGNGGGQIGNSVLGPFALSNVISADPDRDSLTYFVAPYGFTVTGQFDGSDTGNHAYVDIFDLEGA